MKKYQTGTREDVLRYMAECAIRDREDMIDAHTPPSYLPITPASQAVIDDCRACIADFKRIAGIAPAKRSA